MKNRYLDWIEKNAANAFTKKYRDGNLSPGSLTRIQGAGMVRGPEQMAAGINRGSKSILKKEAPRYKMWEGDDSEPLPGIKNTLHNYYNKVRKGGGGYVTAQFPLNRVLVPKEKTVSPRLLREFHPALGELRPKFRSLIDGEHKGDIVSAMSDPRFHELVDKTDSTVERLTKSPELKPVHKLLDSVFTRHEVYEASEGSKKGIKNKPTLTAFDSKNTGATLGMHDNLAVIGRESNLVSSIVPHSPDSDVRKFMGNMRAFSGEASTDHWKDSTRGAPYGKGKLSNKLLGKLRQTPKNAKIQRLGLLQSLLNGKLLRRATVAHVE